jgi:hypothetical protein
MKAHSIFMGSGKMEYFFNGHSIGSAEAFAFLDRQAMMMGRDPAEILALWKAHQKSEAVRDALFDLSDCQLEIIAD